MICDCSFDYGPCPQHATAIVIRDGAAVRTADQLALCFIDDALSIDADILSAWGKHVVNDARRALQSDSWISDPALSESLSDIVSQVESSLSELVVWDDGYVIYQLHDDCPLND